MRMMKFLPVCLASVLALGGCALVESDPCGDRDEITAAAASLDLLAGVPSGASELRRLSGCDDDGDGWSYLEVHFGYSGPSAAVRDHYRALAGSNGWREVDDPSLKGPLGDVEFKKRVDGRWMVVTVRFMPAGGAAVDANFTVAAGALPDGSDPYANLG